jgi:hypothetical protein
LQEVQYLGDSLEKWEKCSLSEITQKGHVSPLSTVLTAQLICQMQARQESFPNKYKGENWKGLSIPQVLEFLLGDLNRDQASNVFLEIDGLQCQKYLINLNKIILNDRFFSAK